MFERSERLMLSTQECNTLLLLLNKKVTHTMDRSWINAKRTSDEYENGVEEFLNFAQTNLPESNGQFYCPCVNCLNERRLSVGQIREHILCDGFCKSYTKWTWHGELLGMPSVSQTVEVDINMEDWVEDMIRDVGHASFERANMYDNLSTDSEKPLYPRCTTFTRLSAVLRLFTLKARNGWSDKSFTELLELLVEMLPEGNTLPKRNYEAKKVLCPMGMQYKKIHTCPNDCILYRNEFEGLHECPVCQVSRYKLKDGDSICNDSTKRPPAKVLWYLPIIPRFKRLFCNKDEAKNLRWHVDERLIDGKLRHPADGLQWKMVDQLYPDFGNEPRNLRLGLATDGMNPYGPQQPGNDIDVYLTPLIEDLQNLWEEGVEVFDAYEEAIEFCTEYLSEVEPIGVPKSRHEGRHRGRWKPTFGNEWRCGSTSNVECKSNSQNTNTHLFFLRALTLDFHLDVFSAFTHHAAHFTLLRSSYLFCCSQASKLICPLSPR
ncbi:hypothetical protein VNO77_17896 [Canavalia gladiata]|uniref:Transposase-associated domain-containing protein n=1 Tax=Canavalia gladiata TaxID=3824 RepID=A0AAN9LJS1_CANGL